MDGVGTKRVFEDDQIIVWYLELAPTEQCRPHTHRLDYVARVIAGATLEVFGPAGESLYTVVREPGEAMTFQVAGDQVIAESGSRVIPATHSVKNIGSQTFKEVLVEFKR